MGLEGGGGGVVERTVNSPWLEARAGRLAYLRSFSSYSHFLKSHHLY